MENSHFTKELKTGDNIKIYCRTNGKWLRVGKDNWLIAKANNQEYASVFILHYQNGLGSFKLQAADTNLYLNYRTMFPFFNQNRYLCVSKDESENVVFDFENKNDINECYISINEESLFLSDEYVNCLGKKPTKSEFYIQKNN